MQSLIVFEGPNWLGRGYRDQSQPLLFRETFQPTSSHE